MMLSLGFQPLTLPATVLSGYETLLFLVYSELGLVPPLISQPHFSVPTLC